MKTRHDENIKTTSEILEMKGLYLAKRLLRTWSEDFVDEDTGAVVAIERNEIIFEKGTLLDHDNLSQVNFLLQSGDITEVEVSDIKRECTLHQRFTSLWSISIDLSGKGKTIYLYANSITIALEIATDYAEQTYKGYYSIKGAKEIGFGNLLTDLETHEEDEEYVDKDIYKIEIEITQDEEPSNSTFILKASDAEDAKSKIGDFITAMRIRQKEKVDFELKIISAKTIPCHFIVDPEFCKKYIELDRDLIIQQDKEIEESEED